MVSSVCGTNQVRQVCLAYSQAWWWECHNLGLYECCQYWGSTVNLQFIEGTMNANMYCGILKQSMIPLPFGNWGGEQYSNMITSNTPQRPPLAF